MIKKLLSVIGLFVLGLYLTSILELLSTLGMIPNYSATTPVFALNNTLEEKIDAYSTRIQINQDGTIDVTEDIVYSFGTNSKHGIYRNIPLIKTNQEGEKFKLGIDNIHVARHPFTVDQTREEVKIKIGDPDKLVTGIVQYTISYTVSGALTYFSDHDELYWNTLGHEWNVSIMDASATIILPLGIEKESVKGACYTGRKGVTESSCTQEWHVGNLLFETKRRVNQQEGFTIVVSFPKGHVAELMPKKDSAGILTYLIFGVLLVAGIFVNIVLPIKIFTKWWKDRKNTKEHQKLVAAWFEPPKNDNGSVFTPAETLGVVKKGVGHKAITATIIHLAQKGFLKIHVKSKRDVEFEENTTVGQDALAKLTPFEKDILEALFPGKKTETDTKKIKKSQKFYTVATDLPKQVLKRLLDNGMFAEDPHKVANTYTFWSVFGAVLFSPLLFLSALFLGRKSAQRTLKGIEKYSEALSLKNFLVSQDEQLDYQADKQLFFEKLLPYATAFGVENIWAKRFADLKLENSTWYDGDINNAAALSQMSRSLGSSVRSSATSTTSSSGFSSGFSGGSSGGGGGGGGGGSW